MVKFLIVRFSSIGDIVLTTPVIRCLKHQVEGAEIHFLTKKKFASVVQANPYIDHLHVLDDDYAGLMRKLKTESFDYIIDLHRNLRTSRLRRYLKRTAFEFNKLNLKKWLLVNFKINKLPDRHIVDRYMDTVNLFDVQNDGLGLDYFIPEDDHYKMDRHIPEGNKFGVFVVGAKHTTKQIPLELATQIIDKCALPVVLLGGKEDVSTAEQIINRTNQQVINLVGELSLNQSASVVLHSSLVISPDTGLMHIASAFKKDIISIWGNTIPEFGMYPYLPGKKSRIFEVQELNCRPCSKIGYQQCPKKHFSCMLKQDEAMIASYVATISSELLKR